MRTKAGDGTTVKAEWPAWVTPSLLGLGSLCVALVFARNAPDSYDSDIMQQVTSGMVNNWDFHIARDTFGLNTPYSSYGIAMSLVMIPLYLLAEVGHGNRAAAMSKANVLVFTVFIVLLYRLSMRLGASARQATLASVIVGFGTIAFSYVSTGFSELGVACSVVGCLVALESLRQHRPRAAMWAGVASGVGLLFRTDSMLLIGVVTFVAMVCSARSWRSILEFALGIAPAVLIWSWYNAYRFGAPWRVGYGGRGFVSPSVHAFHGLLLSPGRGIFIYVPLVILVVVHARACYREFGAVFLVGSTMLIGRVFFYSSWFSWEGGATYGPRFLLLGLPVIVFPVLYMLRRFNAVAMVWRVGFVAIVVLGFYIALIGASVDYLEQWYRVVNPAGLPARSMDLLLFHWEHFPVVDQTKMLLNRDHLAGAYWKGSGYLSRVVPLSVVGVVLLTYALLPHPRVQSQKWALDNAESSQGAAEWANDV